MDKQGIKEINNLIDDEGETVQTYKFKKEPIKIQYKGVHIITLVPPPDSESWTNYTKHPYRHQELGQENDVGLKRQFDLIDDIVSKNAKQNQQLSSAEIL